MAALENSLLGRRLSDFFVEKHEHPTGSNQLSELPIRVWVMMPDGLDALEISVGSAGCSIQLRFDKPTPVHMAEYGRTLIMPQFLDENMTTARVVSADIEPCDEGEKLNLCFSNGAQLTLACHGDDELRPSLDQSRLI